jgi:hypothetical protein
MRLPVIRGVIRRRLLVNFRVDAQVMQRFLPAPFRPKLHGGYAIAGICLIRLEEMRPAWAPAFCGLSSENAAHRVAVEWDDAEGRSHEGVYIPRRDTSSWLNHITGGPVFPGEHNLADFEIKDDGTRIDMSIRARDKGMSVKLCAQESDAIPSDSCFKSLDESSAFFEGGSIGFSATRDCCRLDALQLQTREWRVRPLAVNPVESSFFSNEALFPLGSAVYDHALIMRNIHHEWHELPDMKIKIKTNDIAN